ncbi:transcript variant X2 [Nothobranchius furzeri]|uniref:Transcript variant X2 n=1 Tax=Nothobranchius furzeri TaxID=105023 RepID=A0A9D2XHU3_NOTFU|nr:transcript variant X2 [Nothobranchius furzeri]
MADCNVSIDQKRLPGVKEVCKDFAVLEDHCLAYNLQEQEIESHLASNVHKNRLVQKDLQVAKRLQEEEDERAKVQSQKQHDYIERQDNEIAQEIQEELVRQAERQRLMEEEDAAIARKLQEKEKIRDERRRQKQLEATSKDDYYEDHGGHLVHRGSGSVIAETAYGLNEATRELIKLDLREQELKDMEVARKLQQEELKAINLQARAAQMAKDEELARRMMERDKKEYRKNREREKEKEKERERMAMERMAVNRRRPEGNYRPNSEEVVRPRTRDEYEYHRQRNGNNSARSPQPHHDYENVNPSYGYPEHLGVSHPSTRHEVPYKGAYHKR